MERVIRHGVAMATNHSKKTFAAVLLHSSYKKPLSLDEDIAKLLNENISLQDSNCLAEVLGDYFATSDNGK